MWESFSSVPVAIGVGLVVSLLFTEFYGLTVGGMIVPGYLAMNLSEPFSILLTLLASLITFASVRWLSGHAIIYGRRRVVITMLFGFLFGEMLRQATAAVSDHAATWLQNDVVTDSLGQFGASEATISLTVIGFVIPGLIALWMDRTTVLQTLSPLTASTGLVYLTLVVIDLPH